jgi:hypothetical protein
MKAISIRQPWAWAILHAGKDIENRSWSTPYRGELAVHATQIDSGWSFPVKHPSERDLILGAVVGLVEIVDVTRRSSSPWFTGPYGFVLRNPRALARPIPCPGNLDIWDLPKGLENALTTRASHDSSALNEPRPMLSPPHQGPCCRHGSRNRAGGWPASAHWTDVGRRPRLQPSASGKRPEDGCRAFANAATVPQPESRATTKSRPALDRGRRSRITAGICRRNQDSRVGAAPWPHG